MKDVKYDILHHACLLVGYAVPLASVYLGFKAGIWVLETISSSLFGS